VNRAVPYPATKKRIALAHDLIWGKHIILIDEGTSRLDEDSALLIEENLVTNPNLTVIMITHQLRKRIKEKLDGFCPCPERFICIKLKYCKYIIKISLSFLVHLFQKS